MLVNEPNFVAVEPLGLCGGCIIKLRLVGDDFREGFHGKKWSGRQDLNLRHPAPKAGALPDCATPRGLNVVENQFVLKKSVYTSRGGAP